MDETTIDFAAKTEFVNVLLACPTMRDRNTRDQIVDQLTKVRGHIPRSETDRIDVTNIVSRALDFDGGLAQLLVVLRAYEGESRHMQNVDALYRQHAIAQGPLPSGDDRQLASKTPDAGQATQRSLCLFLCHASGDKVEVRNFYERLRLDGMEPWLDEKNLLPGQRWQQEIPQAVRQADVVIVALSHNAVNAHGYIRDEIRFALDAADKLFSNTIYIIPVKLEECDVPEQLARWQWVNLFDADGYERLLSALEMRAQEVGAKPPVWKSGVYNYVTQPEPPKSSSWLLRWAIGALLMILFIALAAMVPWDRFISASGEGNASPIATPIPPTSIPPTTTSIPPTSTLTPILPTLTLDIDSIYVNPVDGALYIYVPSGKFIMGSSDEQVEHTRDLCRIYYHKPENCKDSWFEDEQPQHTVDLDEYWIMETEVTNAQYRKFIEAGGYTTETYWSLEGWAWRTENSITRPRCWDDSNFNSSQQPVVCVSWYEAEAYADWLSADLPTEAQWEKAARGSDGRSFPWGNDWDSSRVNYCDENCTYDWADKQSNDGYQYTAPVGSYPTGTSPYGALDMAGNVWEWTSDWYDADYYKNLPDHNPTGPKSGERRVVRGGSWYFDPKFVHAANRSGYNPVNGYNGVGFRVVLSAPPD